jgi:hypothetical protein
MIISSVEKHYETIIAIEVNYNIIFAIDRSMGSET